MVNDRVRWPLIWAVALLVLLGGAIVLVAAGISLRERADRLRRTLAEFDHLRAIEGEIGTYEAAREAVEAYTQPPVSVDNLAQDLVPGSRPEIRESRQDLVPGWHVRQVEIAFDAVAFSNVVALAEKAESHTPPWRLRKFVLRASHVPGRGQALLVMDIPERDAAATAATP